MGKKKDREERKARNKANKNAARGIVGKGRGRGGGDGGGDADGGRGKGGDGSSSKAEDRATKKALRKQRNRAKHATDQQKLTTQLEGQSLLLVKVKPDGNCLFRSISLQLTGSEEHHARYRAQALAYMKVNRPDFEFFVEDDEPWDDYLARLAQDKEWGGNLELKALSDVLRVGFVIHQLDAPCLTMRCAGGAAARSVHLAYSGMMHYDSVRHASDTAPPGKPATPFELGAGFSAAGSGGGGGGGGGGGRTAASQTITGVERRVMEETGCPHLEYVRGMLARVHGVADLAVEELQVELAMADFNWDRVLLDAAATTAAAASATGVAAVHGAVGGGAGQLGGGGGGGQSDADVNFAKNVQNVKMITGCPSVELCRRVFEQSGRDVGLAVQELQTIFLLGDEEWPTDEEVRASSGGGGDGDDSDDGGGGHYQEGDMWLVDETSSKNTAFWFGAGRVARAAAGSAAAGAGGGQDEGQEEAERPRVWRRIDLPAPRPARPAWRRRCTHTPDPQDDEEEVYGKATGTALFEVARIVKDDDEGGGGDGDASSDGDDDNDDDDDDDDDVEVVVPWLNDDEASEAAQPRGGGGGGNAAGSSSGSSGRAKAPSCPPPAVAARRRPRTISRNKPCPCGSKLKYKACCHPSVKLRRARHLEKLKNKHGDDDAATAGVAGGEQAAPTIRAPAPADVQVVAI